MSKPHDLMEDAQRKSWVELRFKKGEEFRANKIAELFPIDAKSCLDIGPAATQVLIRGKFELYATVDLENADYNVNLLLEDRIPVPDESFDIVLLSHILEHLTFPEKLAEEAKRISRKYIYVALPNEYSIFSRIRWLFGIGSKNETSIFGHKYMFSVYTADKFVNKNFGSWEKRRCSALRRGNFYRAIYWMGKFLVRIDANLFASETAYLIKN